MAATAKISYVANGAGRAIERRVFPVNIVFPARRVRNGHHHLVAANALLLAHCRRRDVQVANETRRARFRGFLIVMQSESFSVRRRLTMRE